LAVVGQERLIERLAGAVRSGGARADLALRNGRASRGAPRRVLEAVLVILLGVLLLRLLWLLFAPLPLPAPLPTDGALAVNAPPGDARARVGAKSPFPAAPVELTQAAPVIEEVVETTLDLTLTGVWTGSPGGSAVIRTPDGKQARFEIGDEIVSGVTLNEIHADRIIISRAGLREVLRFETKLSGQRAASAPRQRQTSDLRQINTQLPASARPAAAGGLASILRVSPATDENGKRTFELYASRNRQVFAALGLRDGDRLVSINGSSLPSNPAALSSVLGNLQRQSSASLIIRRDGEEIPISLKLPK